LSVELYTLREGPQIRPAARFASQWWSTRLSTPALPSLGRTIISGMAHAFRFAVAGVQEHPHTGKRIIKWVVVVGAYSIG